MIEAGRQRWSEVDAYVNGIFVGTDAALEAARAASEAAGLPDISVTPAQGKFLALLAQIRGARSILEIGTLGAYSTIWLARALPAGGRLISLEVNPRHAEVAKSNLARAGVASVVEVRLGEALETLPKLEAEGAAPFDYIFIDADKPNIAPYFGWAVRLSAPGTVIVVDNVIRNGAIIDAGSEDPNVQGVRRFNDMIAAQPGVSATTLQTVGAKGYDGFTLAVVQGMGDGRDTEPR
jgi:predicted O-methyltransferase YrrM